MIVEEEKENERARIWRYNFFTTIKINKSCFNTGYFLSIVSCPGSYHYLKELELLVKNSLSIH